MFKSQNKPKAEIQAENSLKDQKTVQLPQFLYFLIILLSFCALSNKAHADRCWLTGGCENTIAYVYVPPMQYDENNYRDYSCVFSLRVFEEEGLPEIGSIVEPHHNDITWYNNINDIDQKSTEVEKLFKYESNDAERECLRFSEMLGGGNPMWGGNMKAEIISYLKREENLFVLVKILTSN